MRVLALFLTLPFMGVVGFRLRQRRHAESQLSVQVRSYFECAMLVYRGGGCRADDGFLLRVVRYDECDADDVQRGRMFRDLKNKKSKPFFCVQALSH